MIAASSSITSACISSRRPFQAVRSEGWTPILGCREPDKPPVHMLPTACSLGSPRNRFQNEISKLAGLARRPRFPTPIVNAASAARHSQSGWQVVIRLVAASRECLDYPVVPGRRFNRSSRRRPTSKPVPHAKSQNLRRKKRGLLRGTRGPRARDLDPLPRPSIGRSIDGVYMSATAAVPLGRRPKPPSTLAVLREWHGWQRDCRLLSSLVPPCSAGFCVIDVGRGFDAVTVSQAHRAGARSGRQLRCFCRGRSRADGDGRWAVGRGRAIGSTTPAW